MRCSTSGPGPDLAVDQIGLAVVVPERAGVFETGLGDHRHGRAPRPFGPGGRRHEHALVGGGEVDVEQPVVMTDRRGPDAAGVALADRALVARHPRAGVVGGNRAGQVVFRREGQLGQHVAQDRPVDQVLGLQHRQARREMEGRGDHVVAVAHPDHVGIRIVGVQDRVAIGRGGRRGQEPASPIAASARAESPASPSCFTRIALTLSE